MTGVLIRIVGKRFLTAGGNRPHANRKRRRFQNAATPKDQSRLPSLKIPADCGVLILSAQRAEERSFCKTGPGSFLVKQSVPGLNASARRREGNALSLGEWALGLANLQTGGIPG